MSSQRRGVRTGVEDRWLYARDGVTRAGVPYRKGDRTPAYGKGKRWRARWVDDDGREAAKSFPTKALAQAHIDGVGASLQRGDYIRPQDAQITVADWCATWLESYAVHRPSTIRQARTHVKRINAALGNKRLSEVKPSTVRGWVAHLQREGLATSTVYALHSRLSQIMTDAVHDGVLAKNPCSRRTSPPMGKQKLYVATDAQVWAMHDAIEDHLRPAVLLGAFAGLRVGEVCGLRVEDVDFMRGAVTPTYQYGGAPLKTAASHATIPIPHELALALSDHVARWPGETIVHNGFGDPVQTFVVERAMRTARAKVEGLPPTFTFHDFRHFFASTLIAGGADIKTLQAMMRHASARESLDTYGHWMKSEDDSARDLIAGAMGARAGSPADVLRTVNNQAR